MLEGLPLRERLRRPPVERVALAAYVDAVWEHYRAVAGERGSPVVHPSVPIAWFGDLDAYEASPIRIITVGLNPSLHEFPAADPFQRFPTAQVALKHNDAGSRAAYVGALNAYFRTAPYRRWFDGAYGHVLQAMWTSFYPQSLTGENAPRFMALHTDLYSTLATRPTWSGLDGCRTR